MHWLRLGDVEHPEAPPPRCDAVAGMVGERIYISGGFTASHGVEHLRDVWCFDTLSGRWTEVKLGNGPQRHGPMSATWHDNTLICWAGHGTEFHRNTLYILDPRSPRWVKQQPKWRAFGMPSFLDDAAQQLDPVNGPVVFGGDDGFYGAKLQQFDRRKGGWLLGSAMGTSPSERHGQALAMDGELKRLYVTGGHDGKSSGETWRVNLTGRMRWERVEAVGTSPPPRVGASSWFNCGRLYTFGGFYGDSYLNKTSVLSTSPDGSEEEEWLPIRAADPMPCGRSGAAMTGYTEVVPSDSGGTNRILYVFGGYDGKGYLNDLQLMQAL
eukprot:Hpha_TRINITY_DN18340_c0_g1::TRINITY_DN18340_c0_g1_i1::g.158330::m.158330